MVANKTIGWKTYKDSQYGFEFKYPAGSTVRRREKPSHLYIRLQNYSPDDKRRGLGKGEYYLEISIFDRQKGQKMGQSCQESVVMPQEIKIGNVFGYQGYGPPGGDPGGSRYALCFERPDADLYIQVTERNEGTPIKNRIFDSFKFVG